MSSRAIWGIADGLLSDEEIGLSQEKLCAAAEHCGLTQINQPVFRVEASDCGGHVGAAARTLMGSVSVTQVCGF